MAPALLLLFVLMEISRKRAHGKFPCALIGLCFKRVK
jgi:hypothetical protein